MVADAGCHELSIPGQSRIHQPFVFGVDVPGVVAHDAGKLSVSLRLGIQRPAAGYFTVSLLLGVDLSVQPMPTAIKTKF
jgi:hypothetical protein